MTRKPSLKWPLTEAAFKEACEKVQATLAQKVLGQLTAPQDREAALSEYHATKRVQQMVNNLLNKE